MLRPDLVAGVGGCLAVASTSRAAQSLVG